MNFPKQLLQDDVKLYVTDHRVSIKMKDYVFYVKNVKHTKFGKFK